MDRYVRQVALPEIGKEGQQALRESAVLIAGLGALGSVQAELLARAGIGRLVLVDFDVVEESNLARQALYTTTDIGVPKVLAAKKRLNEINSLVEVVPVNGYLAANKLSLLKEVDIVLDGLDSLDSRFLLNEFCCKYHIPIVFCSAVADRGSMFVLNKKKPEAPCLFCIYGDKQSEEDCASSGVINGATHLSATIAATEAIKYIVGQPSLSGLFSFSLFSNRFDVFSVSQNSSCPVCSGSYEKLDGKQLYAVRFCSSRGCMRADPITEVVTPIDLGLVNSEEKNTEVTFTIDGEKIIINSAGGLFFSTRDADVARQLLTKVLKKRR